MLSVDIMYVISFLIFAFCAYKYGHARMKKTLDDKISAIAHMLSKAQQQKEDAQVILSRMQYTLSALEKTMRQKDNELADRVKSFQEQQKKQLSELMREREGHQQALLIAEKNMALNALKHEMMEHVLKNLSHMMAQDPELQKAFFHQSMQALYLRNDIAETL